MVSTVHSEYVKPVEYGEEAMGRAHYPGDEEHDHDTGPAGLEWHSQNQSLDLEMPPILEIRFRPQTEKSRARER